MREKATVCIEAWEFRVILITLDANGARFKPLFGVVYRVRCTEQADPHTRWMTLGWAPGLRPETCDAEFRINVLPSICKDEVRLRKVAGGDRQWGHVGLCGHQNNSSSSEPSSSSKSAKSLISSS